MWRVEQLCERQLRDVNPEDVIEDGLYRLCDVYKAGGGYDKLPNIISKRLGFNIDEYRKQFVVQLQGCVMRCPYCYVTPDGINSTPVLKSTEELVNSYLKTGVNIFHLMGGSPALYIREWSSLIDKLLSVKSSTVFHSDLLLQESYYDKETVDSISNPHAVYAISIKGCDNASYIKNTNTSLNEEMMLHNLNIIENSSLAYYFTFTGMDESQIKRFCKDFKLRNLENSFKIDLVMYDALKNK